MPKIAVAALSCFLISPLFGQLSPDQKAADFRTLVDVIAKYYAPYEWKRDGLKFDALQIRPWLDRIAQTKDDLDYYDVLVEYIGSLNDAHDAFYLPSTFRAALGFSVDIFDGRTLIDSIDRALLPDTEFPFQIGDEFISVDGKTSSELIRSLEKYAVSANPLSTRRAAAAMITVRRQWFIPRAHEIGDEAEVVIRNEKGETASYKVRWQKTGMPVTSLTPPPAIRSAIIEQPRGSQRLFRAQNFAAPEKQFVTGVGARDPVFQLPEDADIRLGRNRSDALYAAILKAGEVKIGFIRIPNFQSSARARDQFDNEIGYMKENTDGLVIDLMRNPGGSGCAAEAMLRSLFTEPFSLLGAEQNVTWGQILELYDEIEFFKQFNFPAEEIQQLEVTLREYENAYRSNRARTRPLPLCGTTLEGKPAADLDGNPTGYNKPILLLVDEMTYSAAEIFAAVLQDNGRAKLFGRRTVGAGGSVGLVGTGVYSEGSATLTFSLLNRKAPVVNTDLPAAPYVENIGVRPEIEKDYMTRENLMNKGKAFVEAFTAAMAEEIKKSK